MLEEFFTVFQVVWKWPGKYLTIIFIFHLAGPITFKNAKKAVEVAEYVPIDRLLIETKIHPI